MSLKKSVSLNQAVFYGLGIIFGAGIYSLIGSTAGIIGNVLWLVFVLASILAGLTAFSYAELSSYFPGSAAESVFVKKAFNNNFFSFFVGFIVLLTTLFSIATVAWGFTSYFKLFTTIPSILIAVVLILFCTIINFFGIQESIKLNYLLTFVAGGGLIALIIFGLPFVGSVDLFILPNNIQWFSMDFFSAVFSSMALIFFAYIGFEGIANISDEVNSARTVIPKAIVISLLIATIIYVLISIVSVSVVPYQELALATNPDIPLSSGPLALVASKAIFPQANLLLSFAALFATSGTVLLLLVVASRLVYGLSKLGFLPTTFLLTHKKTNTPFISLFLVSGLSIILLFVGNINILGNLTTMGTFLMFFSVNASLIAIRFKENPLKLNFISPINIGRLPILALLGAIFCAFMFITQYWQPIHFFIKLPLFFVGLILFSFSIPIYFAFKQKKELKPLFFSTKPQQKCPKK